MTDKPSTRFLSIRLTDDEFRAVYDHLQKSTCRSLTEYVKKVLTRKPVIVKTRDQSRDEVLQQLITIRNRLDRLVDGFGEPGMQNDIKPGDASALLKEVAEIKLSIRQIAQTCSP
jgi:hypothetical protein